MKGQFVRAAAATRRKVASVFHARVRLLTSTVILFFAAHATLAQSDDDVPPLQPALPEIPPTIWEQHGLMIVGLSMVGLGLVGAAIWWLLQPKPEIPVPIEIQTRQELEALQQAAPDGKTISRASQVLKHYFAVAFGLPPDEMTTTEFTYAVGASDNIGNELAGRVGEFLRECDEQKFSPNVQVRDSAGSRAMELFEAGERRRAELQQAAQPA